MSSQAARVGTELASNFDPDVLFEAWALGQRNLSESNDLRTSIVTTFSLPHNDNYVYRAIASVTLSQVQVAINHGADAGLHAWYLDSVGNPLPSPSAIDILAYTSIFAAHSSPSKALTGFCANAKKGTIRSSVGPYLRSQRQIPSTLTIPKSKKHVNPYYDYWVWSCLNLEWAGPDEGTARVKTSHHILPVFMHHFGCLVPSYESLEIIKYLAESKKSKEKKAVLEMGSGNGYWAYMLRKQGVEVIAVDNRQSVYRTVWINDTIIMEGQKYLGHNHGCKDNVLLMVYPVVGDNFTAEILKAYKGDVIVVAGTQNHNGYTAFRDKVISDYVAEEIKEFEKTFQIPLPSFAGKDDALFVFERKNRITIE